MRRKFAVFFIMLITAAVTLHAVYPDDIVNKAMELYPKDKTAALAMMTNLYKQASGQIIKIRQMLISRGFYTFYMEFLRMLPKEKQVAGEIIFNDFTSYFYDYLAEDIRLYLKYYHQDVLITSYYRSIADDKAVAALGPEITDPVFFEILKRSLILCYLPQKLDDVLIKYYSKNISPSDVEKFILDSWKAKPRDLGLLLTTYGIQDNPAMKPFYIHSLFYHKKYQEVIEYYQNSPSSFPKDKLTSYQIDVPYYLAYSYFISAEYSKALDYIGKVITPWNYDLNKFVMLCYLGMDDYKQVKMWMPKTKDNDTFQFIKSFIGLLEGKTNDGVKGIELYLSDTGGSHHYTIEALLLAFTYYNNPSEIKEVAQIIKQYLLGRPFEGMPDISLSPAYVSGQELTDTKSQSKIISDFVQYKKCVQLMKNGKNGEASVILSALIKSKETSALIRALAVFQLRKIPQGDS